MRVVFLSDTHGKHDRIAVPDGDVLVHCGDVTMNGEHETLHRFGQWLGDLPHRHIVMTWGNHDRSAERNPQEAAAIVRLAAQCEVHILLNQSVTISGRVFHGLPYSNPFCGWAFMPKEVDQPELFKAIPQNVDVLFSHGPPANIGDRCSDGRHVGSHPLLDAILSRSVPVVACGHIHESYGVWPTRSETTYLNCSVLNERYEPANAPIVVDL